MFEVTTIIAMVLPIFIGIIGGYFFAKNLNKLSSFQVIDKAFLSFFVYAIISRILGLIYFFDNVDGVGWSLLPVTQPDQQILYLETWPWIFFRISDGLFLFAEPMSAFIIAVMISAIFHQNKNMQKAEAKIYQYSLILFSFMLLPLYISMFVNNYLQADFQISIVFLFLLNSILGIVLSIFLITEKFQIHLYVLAMQIFLVVFLVFFASQEANELFGVFFVYSILIVINFFSIIREVRLKYAKKPEVSRQPGQLNRSL